MLSRAHPQFAAMERATAPINGGRRGGNGGRVIAQPSPAEEAGRPRSSNMARNQNGSQHNLSIEKPLNLIPTTDWRVMCSGLPRHVRRCSKLPGSFIVFALIRVDGSDGTPRARPAAPDGSQVTVYAGNKEIRRAMLLNRQSTLRSGVAFFDNLRFIEGSGRGQEFFITVTIENGSMPIVAHVRNTIKVTSSPPSAQWLAEVARQSLAIRGPSVAAANGLQPPNQQSAANNGTRDNTTQQRAERSSDVNAGDAASSGAAAPASTVQSSNGAHSQANGAVVAADQPLDYSLRGRGERQASAAPAGPSVVAGPSSSMPTVGVAPTTSVIVNSRGAPLQHNDPNGALRPQSSSAAQCAGVANERPQHVKPRQNENAVIDLTTPDSNVPLADRANIQIEGRGKAIKRKAPKVNSVAAADEPQIDYSLQGRGAGSSRAERPLSSVETGGASTSAGSASSTLTTETIATTSVIQRPQSDGNNSLRPSHIQLMPGAPCNQPANERQPSTEALVAAGTTMDRRTSAGEGSSAASATFQPQVSGNEQERPEANGTSGAAAGTLYHIRKYKKIVPKCSNPAVQQNAFPPQGDPLQKLPATTNRRGRRKPKASINVE